MFLSLSFGSVQCALPVSSHVVAQIFSQAAMIDTCHLRPGTQCFVPTRRVLRSLHSLKPLPVSSHVLLQIYFCNFQWLQWSPLETQVLSVSCVQGGESAVGSGSWSQEQHSLKTTSGVCVALLIPSLPLPSRCKGPKK